MSITVLVVEDNPDSRKLMVRLLSEEGYAGVAVASAEEARACLDQRPFDVVLLDIRLPLMDGKDLARELRADPRHRDLPIIAVTAQAVRAQIVEILASGVCAVVTKPFDLDELLATMRRLAPASRVAPLVDLVPAVRGRFTPAPVAA